MTHLAKFALLGTVALLAAVGCQREQAVDNPFYNSETNEVLTNFVFNVNAGSQPRTKMTAQNTQADLGQPGSTSTFRGIKDAELIAYKLGTSNDGKYVTAANVNEVEKVFSLGTAVTAGYFNLASEPKSKRVMELSVPSETNAFLFYGRAIKDGTDDAQGRIDFNVNKNLGNTTFSLVPRLQSGSTLGNQFGQMTTLIEHVLNLLTTVSISETITHEDKSFSSTLHWYDYTDTDSAGNLIMKAKSPVTPTSDLWPLEEILSSAYVTMNTIYPNECRAGSGKAIARMIGDLWEVLKTITAITSFNSLEEKVANKVANAMVDVIDDYFTESGVNCSWKTTSSVITNLVAKDNTVSTATFNDITDIEVNTFPMDPFNIPLGAPTLTFDVSNHTYAFPSTVPASGMGVEGSFTVYKYTYPAELCYWGNSPIRTTSDSHTVGDYPDGVSLWYADSQWAAGAMGAGSQAWSKDTHVTSDTRSVAMRDCINYGNAMLKTTVRYGASSLQDNNAAIQLQRKGATEANNTISATAGNFILTGILIGGQVGTVGWDYLPVSGSSFENILYDKAIPNTQIPTYSAGGAKSAPCYTLVWDNWDAASQGNKQRDVYVGLEFQNLAQDFWGLDNLVRNNGYFYIIGKLDPDKGLSTTDRSDGVTWPTATEPYALPPYKSDGSTLKERRVFIQDFMTEADFVLGATSLQHAYITVPDLRSTQLSLGMSVDLQWRTGLVFNNVILGE